MNAKTPQQCANENLAVFIERGPGLSSRYQTFVVARDRAAAWVLLAGLGGMGIGQMWRKDDGSYAEYPGYSEAPEASSKGGFGTMSVEDFLAQDKAKP